MINKYSQIKTGSKMAIQKILNHMATKKCNLALIPYNNLYELKPNNNIIGQDRAIESIKMAVNIPQKGYNIFAMGESGIGKQKIIYELLTKYGNNTKKRQEWVYVNNFKDIYKPLCIPFAEKEAKLFKKQMDNLILDITILLQSNFEGNAYRAKISSINESLSNKTSAKIDTLTLKALDIGLSLIKKEESFLIIPLKNKEKPLEEEDFLKLTNEEKIKIENNIKKIKNELTKILNSLPALAQEKNLLIETHNLKIAQKTINSPFNKLIKKWAHNKLASKYLEDAYEYILENYTIFLKPIHVPTSKEEIIYSLMENKKLDIFNINILLDDEDRKNKENPPIVFLDNPNYSRLFGKIEYKSQLGMLSTDVNLIKAGALHLANGGYLILNARKILEIPWLWEALKHTIKSGKINFLTPENAITSNSIESLDPNPVDLDVKIILIGESNIYYQLWEYDPEFKSLFKIVADFQSKISYKDENIIPYLQIICSIAKATKIRALDKTAMGKLIEIASRLVDSQLYLTSNFSKLKNIMLEANYLANKNQLSIIGVKEIENSFEQQKYRQSSISEQMQENISGDIIHIDTKGEQIGQINGLAVMSINDMHFGIPQRITCSVYKGNQGLINIERGVNLSGKIHSKGVLILQAYLNERFSKNSPITFSASIVFEQSYGGVDGDSATCAEFLTLVSGLANTPLSQALAITGSMDQRGRVQAIGGVNQKIAGFFKSCKQKGLHSKNGVVIPKSNILDLTLDEEILEAIENGTFNIYAIDHIDDAMELFMDKLPEELNKIILSNWQSKKGDLTGVPINTSQSNFNDNAQD
jgi:predicted ATP-dependent protease